MKQYEKQKEKSEKELKDLSSLAEKEKLEKFLKAEGKLVSSSIGSTSATTKTKENESQIGKKLAIFFKFF